MADSLEFLQGKAAEMVSEYAERNQLFDAMDQMFHGEYKLPGDLEYLDWIVKQVSSWPFDAINSATLVLTPVEPKITYQPRMASKPNRERADEIEQMLLWWLLNASKRRKAGVISDVLQSAIMYDTVALRVSHLGYARDVLETHSLGSKVFKNYERFGPFAIIVDNPRDVYPIETDYGLEAVLSVRVEKLAAVEAFWGARAESLTRKMKDRNSPFSLVTVYDYQDLEQRAVWAVPGEGDPARVTGQREAVSLLAPEEHGLAFLPWVFRSGSTNLATSPEKRLKPLLYPIYRTNQWLNENLLKTTIFSEALATAAQPMTEVSGPHPETAVEEDWETPGGERLVKTGHQTREIQRRQLDQALAILADRLTAEMDRATGVRVLMDASTNSGTVFAAQNLAVQTALSRLKTFKRLGEVALADACEHMLLWGKQSGKPLYAYGMKPSNQGQQLMVMPDEIDPTALYIDVELQPDIAVDQQARINGAQMLINQGFSKARAWEGLGITDADQAMQEAYWEQMEQAFLTQAVQATIAELNQLAQMRMQAMLQQAQAQAAPQGPAAQNGGPPPGPPAGGGPPPGPPPERSAGSPFPGGPGYNPAAGGLPPQMANPAGTRELVSGRDRRGNELP